MKAIRTIFICIGWVALCNTLQSCSDCNDPRNPDCDNYNPCIDAQATSAAFTMEEVIFARASDGWPNGDKIVYDTDTCRNWNDIVFTCTQKADSIWWIFDDTEMRPEWQQKQSFSIKFGAPGGPMQTQPERVKITCIVKNNKPNPCIPNDNGMDTFTRYMVYMPWWQMGFMGTFRGSLSHKPDSIFLLEIRMDTIDNGPLTQPTYFVRFDNLLTVPPLVPTDDFRPEGFEYSWNPNFGFSVAYLEFFAADPEIAQKYNSNYKGVSHRGKAIFDSRKQELKIDFIRGGYGMSTMREWPPKDQTLYTFTGIKL